MANSSLSPFQRECIELFVHAAAALSLPKSFGEIYGLLFSTEEPLAMDGIIDRLRLSKGSVSQGLKWLKDLGAVQTIYVAGDRRDHYVAEIQLRRLATGFLREQVEPRLASGSDRLRRLEQVIKISECDDQEFQLERIDKLKTWLKFSTMLLPVLQKLTVKF